MWFEPPPPGRWVTQGRQLPSACLWDGVTTGCDGGSPPPLGIQLLLSTAATARGRVLNWLPFLACLTVHVYIRLRNHVPGKLLLLLGKPS